MSSLPKLIPQITIDPVHRRQVLETPIETTTYLFREGTGLNIASTLAVDAFRTCDRSQSLSALSVGCSIGAEVDSALVYLTRYAPELGSITFRGIDINGTALTVAKKALYYASMTRSVQVDDRFLRSPESMTAAEAVEAVPEFEITELADTEKYTCGYHEIDHRISTERFRTRHTVSFSESDVTKPSDDIPPVDFITCNWLLYHLHPGQYARVFSNLTNWLKPYGVLSLGMSRETGGRRDFIDQAISNSPLRPIGYIDAQESWRRTPFIFQKTR